MIGPKCTTWDPATQFPDASNATSAVDVVIGFDFGTACTKVIFRTPYADDARAWAIPFDGMAHPTSQYLLPSQVWLSPNDEFSLSKQPEGVLCKDIKRSFVSIDPECSADNHMEAEVVTVAFLALTLHEARTWFLKEVEKRHRRSRIVWHFNLGMPSADYADTDLCDVYKRVADAAWLLSQRERITVETAEEALNYCDAATSRAEINVVPEVAAEVVGYAHSHFREEGLHVMVDVGAGTLDICGFILRGTDGEDRYRLLTGDVTPLGVIELYNCRMRGVQSSSGIQTPRFSKDFDPISSIPDDLTAYAPLLEQMPAGERRRLEEGLQKANAEYSMKFRRRLWTTVADLKTKRCPHEPQWGRGSRLSIFLCGGGAAVPLYKDALRKFEAQFVRSYVRNSAGIKLSSLPKPRQLEATIGDELYHRLAVAWGLSCPEIDIGAITRPAEIEDIISRKRGGGGLKCFLCDKTLENPSMNVRGCDKCGRQGCLYCTKYSARDNLTLCQECRADAQEKGNA